MRISIGWGGLTSTSSITSGSPASHATAATFYNHTFFFFWIINNRTNLYIGSTFIQNQYSSLTLSEIQRRYEFIQFSHHNIQEKKSSRLLVYLCKWSHRRKSVVPAFCLFAAGKLISPAGKTSGLVSLVGYCRMLTLFLEWWLVKSAG